MRNSLQNLLIFLALCLCGLVAFQWHREARLGKELQSASQEVRDQSEAILNLQKSLQLAEEEVKRLGRLRSSSASTAESNRIEITALKRQFEAASVEIERSTKQIEAFQAALRQANSNIQRQNESIERMADERNDAVVKFNELVIKYNNLVEKWNTLPAAATNTLPKK